MGATISPPTDVCKLRDIVVFNSTLTAANTWQDLDLSAYVGANSALCYFEIQCNEVTGVKFWMKTKGYGFPDPRDHAESENNVSCSVVTELKTNLVVVTNNEGIIQIACDDNVSTITIKLVGLIR